MTTARVWALFEVQSGVRLDPELPEDLLPNREVVLLCFLVGHLEVALGQRAHDEASLLISLVDHRQSNAVAGRATTLVPVPDDRPRFFVPVPPGFFDLSPEEQEEIGLQMAREAQRQMGITPDA